MADQPQESKPTFTKGDAEARRKAQIVLDRRELPKDFGEYFRHVWPIMDPINGLIPSWHFEYMGEWITYAESGQMKREHPEKVGIWFCVPPGTAKSYMISVALPTWLWTRNPADRIIVVSYGDDIAVPMSVKRRDVIQSEWYAERWPKVRIKTDANLKTRFDNSMTGYMNAATRKSGITGIRGSHIIMDDLLKVFEAYSEPFLKEANTLYDETLRSRFVDQANNYFLGISQRLHENDIVGFLREKEPERWFFIDIPLECEEDTDYVFPISGKVYHRKKGDVLLPKMFPPEAIAGFKKNPRVWSGQYQQKPSPAGGYIFIPERWGSYDPANPPDPEFQIMSLDATFNDKRTSDLVALHCYGVEGPYRWLLDRDTRRMDITATMNAIRAMKAAHPKVSFILIEDKANGPAIMQLLQQEIPGMLAITPLGSKLQRAHAASADQASGHIILPNPEKLGWVQPFIDTFAAYNGEGTVKHDDDIDAMTQAINWLRTRNCGVSDWMQQQVDKTAKAAEQKASSRSGRSRVVIQQGF